MKMLTAKFALGIALLVLPLGTRAAQTPFVYAGWLPFWKKQDGAMDTALNLERLREVSPFSYEVGAGGTLKDKLKIDEGLWPAWLSAVHDLHIKIIPTIAWFDGDAIHALLSKKKSRIQQENAITKLVVTKKFDGIDIDYESKNVETRPYFSLFIQGLASRLHGKHKTLSCTIESRPPPVSLPDTVEHSNDYAVLNSYCDEVRLMAYDQGTIDSSLNAAKGNSAWYAPVADPDWVEKLIKDTARTIKKSKIMLGIPTYGYEYEVNWNNGVSTYRRLRSVNYTTAMDVAERVGITPQRNNAGELSLLYATSTSITVASTLQSNVSSTAPQGFSSSTLESTPKVWRFVSFTDKEAAAQKIQLAKKYKLRGAVFFKLDGAMDPQIWEAMK